MRRLVAATLACGLLAGGAAGQGARELSLESGEDNVAMFRKIQCSTRDNEPAIYHWSGTVWSRVPGEPDRLLFRTEGMNVRTCVTTPNTGRGPGARLVSRELMLYLDPTTGEIVDRWQNPWTGKTNAIFHVANDPVNQRPVYPRTTDGKPYRLGLRVQGERAFLAAEIPLFYRNPLGGDYQDQVGAQYHAMEIFDFNASSAELRSRRTTSVNAAIAWVRISGWLPFLEMGGRPGGHVFNATGQKVPSIEALPAVLRRAIAERYPTYTTPPPGNDTRPNATTWTEYKKLLDSQRAAAPAAQPAPKS